MSISAWSLGRDPVHSGDNPGYLAFLNVYDEGRAYTEGGYRAWLVEAGFVVLERLVLADGTSIIKVRKVAIREE